MLSNDYGETILPPLAIYITPASSLGRREELIGILPLPPPHIILILFL